MNQKKIITLWIVLPYPGAERETPIWAKEEERVDFRQDIVRAARCTSAFAAIELKEHLIKTISELQISFQSIRPTKGFFIELNILDPKTKNEGFSIEPSEEGMLITGFGRTGILYGAYEFLRIQGWRWYAPGYYGEAAPGWTDALLVPTERKVYQPAMTLGRGFDFEYGSMESVEFNLWMARNRLNMSAPRPSTRSLCNKLGMSLKTGGHIFEEIMNPDRVMPSGKTLWEEHENWFGLPPDGVRKKEWALSTQFCVSQPDSIEFLGSEFLNNVTGKWKDADRIDVWGFDTWGAACTCADCQKLGNCTDRTLSFISALRGVLNRAQKDGRLKHDVKLATCAYEGTATIKGPENPFPRNLIAAGDYCAFYPINRCYAHDFGEATCSDNVAYRDALKSWFTHDPALPVMIGEYYNVSKFEDLPLLFMTRQPRDVSYYYKAGVRGMTYMHVPMVNWGMRTITQALFAQLAWDPTTSEESWIEEYLVRWYGPHGIKMRKVYQMVEEAWLFISSWRAWKSSSVLSRLLSWDGSKPEKPLLVDDHFKTSAETIQAGYRSIALMEEAMKLLNECRAEERRVWLRNNVVCKIQTAVNPIEAQRIKQANQYEMRLGEDRRLLIYGLDTMKLMTELIVYHDALYREDVATVKSSWRKIEEVAEALDSYFLPMSYEWPGTGLDSKDALTRTQLRKHLRFRSLK